MRTRSALVLRVMLGAALLGAIGVWLWNEETSLRRIGFAALLGSTLFSLLTALVQARVLGTIARLCARELPYSEALRITALGSLGNASGGLPIGTAYKFAVLYRRVGLSVGQITFGLATFSVGISLCLLLFVVGSLQWLDYPSWSKVGPVVAFAVALIAIAAGIPWTLRHPALSALMGPYLRPWALMRVARLSALVTTLFIANSCAVGLLLQSGFSLPELVLVSASGILVSLVSLAQAIAGVQELAMALVSHAVGLRAVVGAEIALVLRASAMVSSGLILLGQFLAGMRNPESH